MVGPDADIDGLEIMGLVASLEEEMDKSSPSGSAEGRWTRMKKHKFEEVTNP